MVQRWASKGSQIRKWRVLEWVFEDLAGLWWHSEKENFGNSLMWESESLGESSESRELDTPWAELGMEPLGPLLHGIASFSG